MAVHGATHTVWAARCIGIQLEPRATASAWCHHPIIIVPTDANETHHSYICRVSARPSSRAPVGNTDPVMISSFAPLIKSVVLTKLINYMRLQRMLSL